MAAQTYSLNTALQPPGTADTSLGLYYPLLITFKSILRVHRVSQGSFGNLGQEDGEVDKPGSFELHTPFIYLCFRFSLKVLLE